MTADPTSHDDRSDLELVAAINAGRPEAFGALYRRYRDWVTSLAWRFTGDRELALDVMQEAFLYLLGKFPGFVLRAKMKTVLYPVVRHLAIAAASKARRTPPPEAWPAPADPPPGEETLALLAAAVAQLPAGQREVLMLRYADDLPLAEIAEALGVPLGTVKSRLHNALEALRAGERTRDYFEP